MIEHRPGLTIFCHAMLLLGVATLVFPVWITLVASTHTASEMRNVPIPLWPGTHMLENYYTVLTKGVEGASTAPMARMLFNSLVMALSISIGKIVISILSAFAIVYFRFPLRMFFFWMIFVTLMLPVQVRIFPTYKVVADLHMIDTYAGLTLPLIASATATFFFRQFFLTVPDELMEAARVDGAGPLRFFWDIVVPLSRTNMAALFVILFIYGWNQYLWPLLVTTQENMYTAVIGLKRMMPGGEQAVDWNLVMSASMLAMLPPVVVILLMQRLFVQGLIEQEK